MQSLVFGKRWILFGALLGLWPSTQAAAQDIFEQPDTRKPPERRGFSFGGSSLTSQAGRRQLQEGTVLAAQGNYEAASLKFYEIVKNMTDSRHLPAAQFQLGVAFYRMKLLHPALDVFAKNLEVGPTHKFFSNSLSWAIQISRELKNESMFLGKLRNFKSSDIPPKYKNELHYLLGKYYFQRTDIPLAQRLKVAIRMLRRVTASQPQFYARAQYIIGAIYDSAKNPQSAAVAFKRAAASARKIEDKAMRQNVFELGILGVARIHYASKHFKGAVNWYEILPRNSSRWLDALFELSWTYLRRGQFDYTLGLLHTLQSPYFENEYYPELGILHALSMFESCRYTDVKEIIKNYLERYNPLIASLNDFLKRNAAPEKMFQEIVRLQQQQDETGLDEDKSAKMFQQIVKLLFRDKPLLKLFEYIKELENELVLVKNGNAAWQQTPLASDVTSRLQADRISKIKEAGERARSRIVSVLSELQGLRSQALKLRYETLGAEKERLNASAGQSGSFNMRSGKKKFKTITVSTADDYAFWPFQGEFWVDELGYYRYNVKGECHRP